MPSPQDAEAHEFTAAQLAGIEERRCAQARGGPRTVERALAELADRFGADELMLATPVYDPKDRIRSFELIARS